LLRRLGSPLGSFDSRWPAIAAVDPLRPAYVVQTRAGDDVGVLALAVAEHRARMGIRWRSSRRWLDGSAIDAIRTMTAGAFRALPIVRIETLAASDDRAAIRAFQRAGYKKEGTLRESFLRAGSHRDAVLLSAVHDG